MKLKYEKLVLKGLHRQLPLQLNPIYSPYLVHDAVQHGEDKFGVVPEGDVLEAGRRSGTPAGLEVRKHPNLRLKVESRLRH